VQFLQTLRVVQLLESADHALFLSFHCGCSSVRCVGQSNIPETASSSVSHYLFKVPAVNKFNGEASVGKLVPRQFILIVDLLK
jgi:hypothetical protein